MTNELFMALAILAVALEACAVVFAFVRKSVLAVVLVNLLWAVVILVFTATVSIDEAAIWLLALAIATLATNLMWRAAARVLIWFVWLEFSAFTALSLAILIFVFTFKLTRLI